MYYKEDFSLKCNKNNCTCIIIAQYHSISNINSWSSKNIKIKFYNEKKNKQYVAVIDMSEIAQAYKLEESFIYVKIDRYYRYSKKQTMYLVNLYKKYILFMCNRIIRLWIIQTKINSITHLMNCCQGISASTRNFILDSTLRCVLLILR